jgi:L-seryl-tRNA(Ser) seleniumtransferase
MTAPSGDRARDVLAGDDETRTGTDAGGPAADLRLLLSSLPQVDAVLRLETAARALDRFGRRRVADAVRATLGGARDIARSTGVVPDAEAVLASAVERLEAVRRRNLVRAINATGVVVHTNLGRAPLSDAAREAVVAAAGYGTVEYDLEAGARGSRTAHLGELAAELCGTEAATVVNNGAAALLLVLAAHAPSREVIISRGELIEIGGSFRLPDVMAMSGTIMVEVGTTNRTRLADYRAAVGEDTALLLKVHRSNFRQVGFTQDTPVSELAGLAAETGVPFVYDLGSGLIRDVGDGPLAEEPSVLAAVADGADVVVFSGDKLLGGPQAGIIAGRAELIAACSRHPLARALRVDKLQRAALEATFDAHLRDDRPLDVPTVAMLHAEQRALTDRAAVLAAALGSVDVEVEELAGAVGGGALPEVGLPSAGLAIRVDDPDALAWRLRHGRVPVIVRIEHGRVLLDLRTVMPVEDDELVELLLDALP